MSVFKRTDILFLHSNSHNSPSFHINIEKENRKKSKIHGKPLSQITKIWYYYKIMGELSNLFRKLF